LKGHSVDHGSDEAAINSVSNHFRSSGISDFDDNDDAAGSNDYVGHKLSWDASGNQRLADGGNELLFLCFCEGVVVTIEYQVERVH
jgi:hypothetical protein